MPSQKKTLEIVKAYLKNYNDLSPMELNHLHMELENLQNFVDLDLKKWGEKIV